MSITETKLESESVKGTENIQLTVGAAAAAQGGTAAEKTTAQTQSAAGTKVEKSKKGDTADKVAQRTGKKTADIIKANPHVRDPMDIEEGTYLVIPATPVIASMFFYFGQSDAPAAWSDYADFPPKSAFLFFTEAMTCCA